MPPTHKLIRGFASPADLRDLVVGCEIVVGAEDTNVINVALQLTDWNGADLAVSGTVLAYFSDDAAGQVLMTTAHSSSPAIGTDGLYLPLITDKMFALTSEADGDIDLDLTETGALTTYLQVILPSGLRIASAVITHAA